MSEAHISLTERQSLPISKAINAGLRAAMAADERVVLMGEDIGPLGGVFRVTDGLQRDFGSARVIDTPLAEAGIVGSAIGLAMAGFGLIQGHEQLIRISAGAALFPIFVGIALLVRRRLARAAAAEERAAA